MDLSQISTILEAETTAKLQVVTRLKKLGTEIDALLSLLGEKPNGKRPRATGNGATRSDVEAALKHVQASPEVTRNGLTPSDPQVETAVRNHLKGQGKNLRGFGNQWKAVTNV